MAVVREQHATLEATEVRTDNSILATAARFQEVRCALLEQEWALPLLRRRSGLLPFRRSSFNTIISVDGTIEGIMKLTFCLLDLAFG